ncbi:MAG: TolC family protein [Pseudomonadota bacterium]
MLLVPEASAQDDIQSNAAIVTMEDAIARVLNAAPMIEASKEAVHASEGVLRQARVRPNPELSWEAADIIGSGPFEGIDRAEITLGIEQRIERGGKRNARIGLAAADRDLSALSAVATHADAIYLTRQAYIDAAAALATMRNAALRVEVTRALATEVKQRVQSARDSLAAAERAETRALEAEMALAQADQAFSLAKKRLAGLWGAITDDFAIDTTLLFAVHPVDEAGLTARREAALDLTIAKTRMERATAALTLEQANAKQDPRIKLGVRRFQLSDDIAGVVSFSMPLALFNTNRGNIARAAAEQRQAEWLAREVKQRFDRDFASYVTALRAAFDEAMAYRSKILPTAQAALQETRHGYGRGAFSYLEVLDAQRALQDISAREILALKRFHLANAALERLLASSSGTFPDQENTQ